ncbi:transcription-repair coupling factor [Bartonella sp. DGB1]|uniref:transcription-repair coupling factor n=1 Tax=Bartonella sp. DGB1 TaxID=3239807 RepID=UPI0035257D6C
MFSFFNNFIPKKGDHIVIDRVVSGGEAIIIADLLAKKISHSNKILFIAKDARKFLELETCLNFLVPDAKILHFPAWDCLPYDRSSPSLAVLAERLNCLFELSKIKRNNEKVIILTSVNAILQKVIPEDILQTYFIPLQVGQKIEMSKIISSLEQYAFERVDIVKDIGEFAVRGGVIDIFLPDNNNPIRLDFFGNILENIRTFNSSTQKSLETLQNIILKPTSEVILSPETIENFRVNFLKEFGAKNLNQNNNYQSIIAQRRILGIEHWLPFFYNQLTDFFDYLDETTIVIDHLFEKAIEERNKLITDYYNARLEQLTIQNDNDQYGYTPIKPCLLYLSPSELKNKLKNNYTLVELTFLDISFSEGKYLFHSHMNLTRNFSKEKNLQQGELFNKVIKYLGELRQEKKKILIAGWAESSLERLIQLLKDLGLEKLEKVNNLNQFRDLPNNFIAYGVLPIENGINLKDLIIIGEQDILGDRLVRSSTKKRKASKFIAETTALNKDDIVVHINHGIGRFISLRTITIDGAAHDCLEILYAGQDKLLLPVENIELLSRYGGEAASVSLDRLGSGAWQLKKAKLKKKLLEIAGQLIKTAAARLTKTAPQISVIETAYEEFVARFPYEETEDQKTAIQDTLTDLQSKRPMDRLICGDVGFGKTEVALRAAFVTAMQGYQVAVIVPTTLLSRQHYKNFCQRFEGFGLNIAQVSRMVPAKEIVKTKKLLADGTINIVIGTHALLNKDIKFNNLALLIIDEEQHFGVTHKEKLKQNKPDLHVLTLSATPIPRTLQMSLNGVQDLSLMTIPPIDRMVTKTMLSPFDPLIIRETLLREYYRGGQSFYVCPRISDLAFIENFIKTQVPEIKAISAHGKMASSELDNIMNVFYDGQYDILISTSIIESGLDIPTANSIIIHRADMFGLAALYQLRGRVGRSKQRAYALLTIPVNKELSKTAQQRLKVIQSLDTLGGGFQLANHDMDIRGAGNILGEEQSGHIKEVGFELYQQMLEEAIAQCKGEEISNEHEWSPQISIGTSVMIPESYIPDLQLRISLYRKLGNLTLSEEIESFAIELIDRFGSFPAEVEHLLKIVYIKILCRKANIEKLDAGPKGVVIHFRNSSFANPMALVNFITQQGNLAKIRPDQSLLFIRDWKDNDKKIKGLEALLNHLIKLANLS